MAITTIAQYKDCSTAGCKQLDKQLIIQMNKLAPGILVNFSHLPVTIGAGCHPYLQASAVVALEKAIAARGKRMHLNSAYRTLAQQGILWNHHRCRRCGIKAAAIPGASNHNTGLAIDIEDSAGWRPYLERFGWDWIGSFDPMHYDYVGAGCKDLRYLSIKAFQQIYNRNNPVKIKEDGRWDRTVEAALLNTSVTGFGILPSSAIEAIATLNPPTRQPLRESMVGEEVKELQKQLNKSGAKLTVDGKFGAATTAAVKAFQISSGLAADGVVGINTGKKLWM